MKIEHTETAGWLPALRGMRNPLNSWDRADSSFINDICILGPNDLKLAQNLSRAGSEHAKFLRMVICYADITAPLYWWKQFDTYRMGVEKNSCSTMHKIMSRPLTVEDFEIEGVGIFENILTTLNYYIGVYQAGNNKEDCFRRVVQLLPNSYIQKRTVMMSYAALRNIYFQRRNHKLTEWREFCRWIESLSYAGELICIEKGA